MESSTQGVVKSGREPEKLASVIANGHLNEPAQHVSTTSISVTTDSAEKPLVSLSAGVTELWLSSRPLLADVHPEIWGVTLSDPSKHIPSQIIFQKYLNANDQDVNRALDQLSKTLAWRAKVKPLELLKRQFSLRKFKGLGFVSKYGDDPAQPEMTEVFTWNIYGGVKSVEETFGDLEEYVSGLDSRKRSCYASAVTLSLVRSLTKSSRLGS